MTNTSVKNTFTLSGLLVAVLFSMGAFATVVHADDGFGFYPDVSGGSSISASDTGASSGYGFYPDTGASVAQSGYGFYPDAGSSVAQSGYGFYPDTGSVAQGGYGFYPDVSDSTGYGFYPDVYTGPSIDPNAGTIDMNASTIDVNASSIDTYASSIDANASSVYSSTYNVYSIPTHDYGYATNYGYNYGTAAVGFGLGYALGYGLTYPHYSYQNYPVVASAPSNTSVYSPTSIVAPTNTCTAPNSCNDNSVVSAPTYAQPATAYVSPVVQTVPYYTAQAYVPSYPAYTSPSYVYTAPAPYYAPVNPVVNPSPYVALTQIPYTGYDFGPFGNAMYWIVLAGFAIASAYLVVYYLPTLKFRQANSRGDTLPARASTHAGGQSQGVTSESAESTDLRGETLAKPRTHLGNLSHIGFGTNSAFATGFGETRDMMQVIKSAHGAAPRIVISRN